MLVITYKRRGQRQKSWKTLGEMYKDLTVEDSGSVQAISTAPKASRKPARGEAEQAKQDLKDLHFMYFQ